MKVILSVIFIAILLSCDTQTEVTFKNLSSQVDSLVVEINTATLKFYSVKKNSIQKKSFLENIKISHDVLINIKGYRRGVMFAKCYKFNDLGYVPNRLIVELTEKDRLRIH